MSVSSLEQIVFYSSAESLCHPNEDTEQSLLSYYTESKPSILLESPKYIKTKSLHIRKKVVLTEKELARHNEIYKKNNHVNSNAIESFIPVVSTSVRGTDALSAVFFKKMEFKCQCLRQSFNRNMTHLEAKLADLERGFEHSRKEIHNLRNMQKTYHHKEVQTVENYESANKPN
ncbi:hypothetical protein BY458DRAFT_496004 [Sporodiniella umbellata]|nr:hypothetical protein BY458DRAFT_496004 [Sporodiniella umbellata]